MARHLRTKHPNVYRNAVPFLDKNTIKGPLRSTSWKKGSWGRKYCQKISGHKYKCNMCDTVLSLSNGLFSNMKRHIKSKHPLIYEQEVGGGKSDEETQEFQTKFGSITEAGKYVTEFVDEIKTKTDNEEDDNTESDSEVQNLGGEAFLDENDPEFETKIKCLVMKQVAGRKRARNCFWNFFNVVQENHVYTCLACNRRVSIFPHSIANLKRHIKSRHKYQYSIMMKYMEECEIRGKASPVSFDKYYFNRQENNEFKCKECDSVICCADGDQLLLFEHIKDSHPDQIMAFQEEATDNDDVDDVDDDDDDDGVKIVVVKESDEY